MLNRINPLAFAKEHGFAEEPVIAALVHSAQLGLFDMAWNMLCRSCSGVLETGNGLRALDRSSYFCSFCALKNEPTLDELVEVTFTVNPRIRRIGAHDPDSLPFAEYMRQVFWSSGLELPGIVVRGDLRHRGCARAIQKTPRKLPRLMAGSPPTWLRTLTGHIEHKWSPKPIVMRRL